MDEISPGVHHWTALRDSIGARVSSYYVEPLGIVIDPMVPEEGLDAIGAIGTPTQVVLTTGLHTRHATRFAEAFDAIIRAPREARARLGDTLDFEPYDEHDDIAVGVIGIHMDPLADDEYALHILHGDGALAIGDSITHYGDALGFFADDLLGAHPLRVKNGIKNRFRAQLERDFDTLLFAHGTPIAGDAKEPLRDFVNSPVGYPEFGQAL